MPDADWFDDDDPQSLPRRVERVLRTLAKHTDSICAECGGGICGHEVVMSIVAGHETEPCCATCLAKSHDRDPDDFRDEVALFVHSKPCLTQGWRRANMTEGFGADTVPLCLWQDDHALERAVPTDVVDRSTEAKADDDAIVAQDHFDAGDQGCGDLVLALRIRLNQLPPGAILRLTATDPGALEDIPSWCRLTGNLLRAQRHPDYFIERKASP